MIFFVGIIITFWTLLFVFILYKFYKKRKSNYVLKQSFDLVPKDSTYQYITYPALEHYLNADEKSMAKIQQKFTKAKVTKTYLLHGTFVGNDPFHLIGLIGNMFAEDKLGLTSKMKNMTKKGHDFVNKSFGNFSPEHIEVIQEIIGNDVNIQNLDWSSGNYHYARVMGMFTLVEELSQLETSEGQILLMGHSHAGQIFALLTKYIGDADFRLKILNLFKDEINLEKIKKEDHRLTELNLDFVTFGSPSRYEWYLSKNMRLLHFINHRTQEVLGGKLSGVAKTKGGDYIQQWGGAGSDMISPIPKEMELNKKLDEILDIGVNLEVMRQNINLRRRLHNKGHHIFVDYGDEGEFPNFLKTLFGHAVYTRLDLLKFHFQLISDKFYK